MTTLRKSTVVGRAVSAAALEFVILTAVRAGEARKATWSEFDLEAKVWTIPAIRMKARRIHRVPLSNAAIAVLEAMPRDSDVVFHGAQSLRRSLTGGYLIGCRRG